MWILLFLSLEGWKTTSIQTKTACSSYRSIALGDEVLGRAIPSFRIALAEEESEWRKEYRKYPGRREREAFDEKFAIVRLYISACSAELCNSFSDVIAPWLQPEKIVILGSFSLRFSSFFFFTPRHQAITCRHCAVTIYIPHLSSKTHSLLSCHHTLSYTNKNRSSTNAYSWMMKV